MSIDKDDPKSHSPSSYLSRLRAAFTNAIYQDLQDYVYERFETPSVILVRRPDDQIRPCFPRKSYRGFCDFCRHLREMTRGDRKYPPCLQYEIDFVREGIEAEKLGKKWEWGWRQCHMGLCDYYVPIRAARQPQTQDNILAVLIVGQRRVEGDDALELIRERVRQVTAEDRWCECFGEHDVESRPEVTSRLLTDANEIPSISESKKRELVNGAAEVVKLVEIIATRSLQHIQFQEGEEFLQHLLTNRAEINVGEAVLWKEIEFALDKIVHYLPLETAAVFASTHDDFTRLVRRAAVVGDVEIAKEVAFSSHAQFDEVKEFNGLKLPQEEGAASWMSPMTCFGTDSAFVFARETNTGQLVLIGFGHQAGQELNHVQRLILYEAVNSRLFHFIENALFGVELDHLMGEAGHLMGRARAAVVSGIDNLSKWFLMEAENPDDVEFHKLCRWAIEDGLMRLNLIRKNFYAFRGHRLGVDPEITTEEDFSSIPSSPREPIDETPKPVDVVAILDDLSGFFERAGMEKDRKQLKLLKDCDHAWVKAPENDLRLVFVNLFDNALKFGYAQTYVDIAVQSDNGQCTVRFTNLGIGVPPDETKAVFQRFRRSRFQNKKKRIEGLGLGLPYCRRVVEEDCGGTIRLTSREAPTKSERRFEGDNWLTTVTVSLPQFSPPEKEEGRDA